MIQALEELPVPSNEVWIRWHLGNHGPWSSWHLAPGTIEATRCDFQPIGIYGVEVRDDEPRVGVCQKCLRRRYE